jgi:hypothetical protein
MSHLFCECNLKRQYKIDIRGKVVKLKPEILFSIIEKQIKSVEKGMSVL